MACDLVLNGRFLGRTVTGVERLALELGRGVRHLLAEMEEEDLRVLVPAGTTGAAVDRLGEPRPAFSAIGRLSGHAWEQVELARAFPEAWLLNLCNTGPMSRRRQALVICDAQFVLHPESYSRNFRWWYRVLISLASRRSEVLFTISEFSKARLEEHRLVPRGKAQVLRLGVDHLREIKEDRSVLVRHGLAAKPYVLAIGSLARHKNLATLLDSFVEADLPNVDLVVAGGSNPRVFHNAGLREAVNIRYLGRVSDGELKALYGHAMAFTCPSLSEGFGFTPLEAMTMGCPVVATTGGAVPEVCGDSALYADPLDRGAWRDALRRIVDDDSLRVELGRRAKERAAGFTWRDTARQVLAALAEHDGDHARLSRLRHVSGA